jgi:hypothetical protein
VRPAETAARLGELSRVLREHAGLDIVTLRPASGGESGTVFFDLATLLFYCYDHDGVRERLRARLLELASSAATRAYLAHLVLRQVDWSLRFHPDAPATRRYLRLGRLVIADIGS